jgi:hypothetical protein
MGRGGAAWKPEITRMVNEKFGTDYTIKQIRALMSNRGIRSGLQGRFQKGGKPWNAGTKGATSRNKTTFKKGAIPPNRRPLYAERITREGFVEIKVPERNPHPGQSNRWRHKQAWVWEQHHGLPLPSACRVAVFGVMVYTLLD